MSKAAGSGSSGRAQDGQDFRGDRARSTSAYVAEVQRKWAIVGAAFQDEHPACNEECPHYRSISQRHPYGNGHATEYLCECSLGEQLRDKPEDCPAYQAMKEEAQ